jgi:DNA helicase II / ATP-dependent DNA helicase PcrA
MVMKLDQADKQHVKSPERRGEHEYLERVLGTVDAQIMAHSDRLQNVKRGYRETPADDYNGQAASAWAVAGTRQALETLHQQRECPYFGRIDFLEDGANYRERIYIGRASLYDKSDDRLIHDWRAPLCGMYYQYNVGQAAFSSPSGVIKGQILLKRQYDIQRGTLISIHDSAGTLLEQDEAGIDEMLASLLKRDTAGKMRQIVQSIQAEQDAIIRTDGDIVAVQGPAGCGKTVIALHRAAYLLYQMRQNRSQGGRYNGISAQRVLVFSPNAVFSDYISRVLPDLHEGQVKQIIFDRYAVERLEKQLNAQSSGRRPCYSVECKEDYYECMLTRSDDAIYRARHAGAVFKTSAAMLDVMRLYLEPIEADIEGSFTDIRLEGGFPFSRSEMTDRFRSRLEDSSLVERVQTVADAFETRVKEWAKAKEALAPLSAAQRSELEGATAKLKIWVREVEGRNLIALYRSLWESDENLVHAQKEADWPATVRSIAADTLGALGRHSIPFEDVIPLLLLEGMYRGFSTIQNIDHAVIDEAQDYSFLDFEYIKNCLPKRCTMTIVGDINQAIGVGVGIPVHERLERVFRSRVTRLELTKSYRSTFEIMEFARRILGVESQIESIRRTGDKPKLLAVPKNVVIVDAIAAAVRALLAAGRKSIAVLCRTKAEAQCMYDSLASRVEITLLTSDTKSSLQGALVMPVYLAKGLEFDAVIVADAGKAAYGRDTDRNLLYTACTRALHDLYVYYSNEPSPLLPLRQRELYETTW